MRPGLADRGRESADEVLVAERVVDDSHRMSGGPKPIGRVAHPVADTEYGVEQHDLAHVKTFRGVDLYSVQFSCTVYSMQAWIPFGAPDNGPD